LVGWVIQAEKMGRPSQVLGRTGPLMRAGVIAGDSDRREGMPEAHRRDALSPTAAGVS
jgi:hypothetical protein